MSKVFLVKLWIYLFWVLSVMFVNTQHKLSTSSILIGTLMTYLMFKDAQKETLI